MGKISPIRPEFLKCLAACPDGADRPRPPAHPPAPAGCKAAECGACRARGHVRRRVKALEEAGLITGYVAEVDPERAGLGFGMAEAWIDMMSFGFLGARHVAATWLRFDVVAARLAAAWPVRSSLVALLAALASPAGAQPPSLRTDPALRGLVPSLVSIDFLASTLDRERCGLSAEVAQAGYATLVGAAARHGLALPALDEAERVSEGWLIASGGSTRAGPDQPPTLPALLIYMALTATDDGRCVYSGSVTVLVKVSGTMMTAEGPRPLPLHAWVWTRSLRGRALAARTSDSISRTFGDVGANLAKALRP